MSKIDKLSILGVRSFDNRIAEVIQFHTPLTLIVGFNGSGKTTIIEALRYATTGELPPNSATGGAWIHDPKLCGEKEVLAQVKLQFQSTSGAKMVVTRSLQLQIKKTMRSQKTLDGNLLLVKNGERTSISSRMAELDQIMPQYMGVSKAILESVIFCHQDESLWPMSQPAVLKKKFDEIFEALKYTKAIDNIKVLRKKHKEDLEKFKIIEQHAKETKDRGARAEQKSQELHAEIEKLKLENVKVAEQIKEAQRQMTEMWEHAAQFESIVNNLSHKRILFEEKNDSIAKLKEHMKEMTDSDEELQDLADRYEERVELYRHENEEHMKKYRVLVKQLEENRRALGLKQSEVGKHQAQKDQYERQVENRQTLVKEAARRHGIRGFDVDLTDAHVQDFMSRLSKVLRDQTAAADRARKESQEEVQSAQQALNKLNERRSTLARDKEIARNQIASNEKRIESLQAQIDRVNIDEGGKAVLDSSVQDTERKLTTSKQAFETAGWETKVNDAESRLAMFENHKERLETELINATRQAGDSARLDFLRKELKVRQQMLDTNTKAHGARINDVVGDDWTPAKLESAYQSALKEKSSIVKDSELLRDGTVRELEQVNFKLRTFTSDLVKKRTEASSSKNTIREVADCDPDEFATQLLDAETNLSELRLTVQGNESLKEYFDSALKSLGEHDCCRLCRRAFETDKQRRDFKNLVEKFLRKDTAAEAEQEIANAEQWLTDLKAIAPQYEQFARLQREIPPLEHEIKGLHAQHDKINAQLEVDDQKVRDCESAKKEVEALAKTIQTITKCHSEIVDFNKSIAELESKHDSASHSRGLEAIKDDLEKSKEQIRSVNGTLSTLRSDKDRARALITSLELEIRDLRAKLSTAEHQLRERDGLMAQIDDFKVQNQHQRDSIQRTDKEIDSLFPQVNQAQATYDDIVQRGEDKVKELQSHLSRINDTHNQLKLAEQDIVAYLDQGGPTQLSRATREMANLQSEIERVETDQREVTKDIKKNEDQLRNHAETKRAITDNLLYRDNIRQLKLLETEIEDLEKHNAEADRKKYETEGRIWQNTRNELAAAQATLVGSIKSKDDQLGQLLKDWDTEYKDAGYQYKEAHIKVETTKAAVEDLGLYAGALDKAIMKYHGLKMEEINRIIEELWKKTYQGTDVDTIQIRSENETQKGNKSYNYRVVMVKQDAEMDMRGRCSAGQKVLASIIIRLALAECFGVNCGLIALDEPTTNLDRDNIRALAESLAEIIKMRRLQSNFQIIVITHDEEFLRYMNCSEFAEHYYRVSRNERQNSQIERQSVAEVM